MFMVNLLTYVDAERRNLGDEGKTHVQGIHESLEKPLLLHFLKFAKPMLSDNLEHGGFPSKQFEHPNYVQTCAGKVISNFGFRTMQIILWVTTSTRLSV